MPVRIPERDRAGANHLDARQPGSPVDVLGLESRLSGPDVFLEPNHQRQVIREPAEEGHRRVGMSVDQSGNERHARAVENLVARLRRHIGADLRYLAVLRAKANGLTEEGGIRDRDSHP